MKTNTPQFLRRSAFYFCLLFTALLFVNCSNDDDTPPPTYEFEEDFEDIEDLPEVEDEDPAITEPEVGTVEDSGESLAIIEDIMGASTEAEVEAETTARLNTVNNFTASQPAAVAEAASSLDAAGVDNILDEDTELNATLTELQASLGEVSDELVALLPKINLTTDIEGLMMSSTTKNGVITDLKGDNIISQAQVAPCAEAAKDAFDAIVEDLTAQRDANLALVEANFTRRVDAADTRYEERVAAQATRLQENKDAVKATITALLGAADKAASFGSDDMASQLRQLALYYAVDARTKLAEWNTAVLAILDAASEEEKATAEARRDAVEAQVTASFQAAYNEAQNIFENIDSNCHNQGSGN